MPVAVTSPPAAPKSDSAPSGAVNQSGQSVHFGNPVSWLLAVIVAIAGTLTTAIVGSATWLIAGMIVALVILVFFAAGYGFGRLFL